MTEIASASRVEILKLGADAYASKATPCRDHWHAMGKGAHLGKLLFSARQYSGSDDAKLLGVFQTATPEELSAAAINPANLAAILAFIQALLPLFVKPA